MYKWMESKQTILKIIEKISEEPLVLYGAGKYGKQALKNIRTYFPTLNVRYFIDDNRIRNNEKICGIEIISLNDAIRELGDNFNILITNYYVSEVLEKIEANMFDLKRVFFYSELLIEDIDISYFENHITEIKQVYDMLEDYKSKMIYKTMIESRFTKDINILSRTCDKNQYFPNENWFKISKGESLIDAGAFDGDTIENFLQLTDNKYKKIYAFEPDMQNYKNLEARNYGKDIKIIRAGLYDISQKLSFAANKGGSSKIEINGGDTIQVYAFDELEGAEEKITFVKMDIEGSELKALQGMKHTIIKNKPKLAICIYHKFEDLWELPIYIKKLVPEYQLHIRNYTTYLDEVVLYATI